MNNGTEDTPESPGAGLMSGIALAQAVLYIGTGIWPLVSMRTFEAVTGPKTDRWLVKTVGVLVSVIGGVLAVSGARRKVPEEIPLLAAGSAVGLTAIDCVYVAKKRISRVYLLDAVAELMLVAMWIYAWVKGRQERKEQ